MYTFAPDVRPVSVESIVVESTPRQSFFIQSTPASVLFSDMKYQIVAEKLSIDEDISIDQMAEGNQSINDDQIAAGKRSIGMERFRRGPVYVIVIIISYVFFSNFFAFPNQYSKKTNEESAR
jgi:hypothetical protein